MATECICDDEYYYGGCPVHVYCDSKCGALENPTTLDEVKAALEHWRSHSVLHGCSHGH